jgi:hypothetical protein
MRSVNFHCCCCYCRPCLVAMVVALDFAIRGMMPDGMGSYSKGVVCR